MKSIQKRLWRSILAAMLAASLLSGVPGFDALAAAGDSGDMEWVQTDAAPEEKLGAGGQMRICVSGISIGFASDPDGLFVSLSSSVERPAAVIGVREIVLEEKGFFGWHEVGAPIEGACLYRTTGFLHSFTYKDAIHKKQYRVSATFYANADTYDYVRVTSTDYTYYYR